MKRVELFKKYAAAFEVAYKTDNWELIEPYFADDAVYHVAGGPPLGGHYEGRAAVIQFLKDSVHGFDQRFDQRIPTMLEGPELRDGKVWIRWRIVYKREGLPDLEVDGQEMATVVDDEITLLEDIYEAGQMERLKSYFEKHQGKLLPTPA